MDPFNPLRHTGTSSHIWTSLKALYFINTYMLFEHIFQLYYFIKYTSNTKFA